MEMKMSKEERMLKMIREILVSCPEAGQEFADDYELDAHGVEEIINALQISKTDLEYALDDLINYVPESFFEPKYINEKVLHAWESIPSGIRQLFGTYPEDGSRELNIRTHTPILTYEKHQYQDKQHWISALTPSCVNVFDLFINACTASPDEISADEYPPYEEFLFPLLYQGELDRVELCLEWYKTHEKNPIGEYYFTEYLLNGCMDEKLIITRTRNLKKELRTFIKEHKEIFLKEM